PPRTSRASAPRGAATPAALPPPASRRAGSAGLRARRAGWPLPSEDLEQSRGALAAADAHGHDHVLHATAPALDQRMPHQPRAADAVGVADRDRAAVDVEPVVRDAEP